VTLTTIAIGGESPYDVLVGHDLTTQVAAMLPGATRALIIADGRVTDRAERVRARCADAAIDADVVVVPSGEQAKSLEVASSLWNELGNRRFTRSDAVIAVGGGAVTDVAGFVAATWLRGVRVVQVPTTLLAMVDAAIGGKTAINTNAGKNLVGAFHPPAGVLVDLDVLATLPAQEWVNGMAEVVKAGFIADPGILDIVEADPADAADPRGGPARELIERSIRIKAQVVSADLRETGLRETLNYGHTLGHAIERLEGYQIPHGHAISIGMVFVAALSRLAGRLDEITAARHRSILASIGLPTLYGRHTFEELLDVMRVDKKARGTTLRFVVLDKLAQPAMLESPDQSLLRAAYDEVAR
jgi:3-dehydroquinate synthase